MPGRGGIGPIDRHMGPRPRPRRHRHRPWRTCTCTRDRMNSTVPGGRHSRRPADEPSNALFAPPPIRRPDFSTDNRVVAACSALPAAHEPRPISSRFRFVGLLSRTHTEGPNDSVREWHTATGDRVTRTYYVPATDVCANDAASPVAVLPPLQLSWAVHGSPPSATPSSCGQRNTHPHP